MADVRVNIGKRSRVPGTTVGVEVSTFGLSKLQEGVTGDAISQIMLKAGEPAYEEAHGNWPVLTGASRDSMKLAVSDVGPTHARVVLEVGGQPLIDDPRNTSHKDYAPFIEFNGSPTGRGQGAIRDAIYGRDSDIRSAIHEGVRDLIGELLK
jgi:hypothetical protein